MDLLLIVFFVFFFSTNWTNCLIGVFPISMENTSNTYKRLVEGGRKQLTAAAVNLEQNSSHTHSTSVES